jgi:hypothetical protein
VRWRRSWASTRDFPGHRLEHVQFHVVEAGLSPRRGVQRFPDGTEPVFTPQPLKGRYRIQPPLPAQVPVPAGTDFHMPDLVGQDPLQDAHTARIPGLFETCDHARRDVQPARLQHPRHQRHAHQHIVRGLFRHLPQPVMGGKITVGITQRLQAAAEQIEMQRLLAGHPAPVPVEVTGQAAKPAHRIPGQVDGIEFDMCERMQKGRASRRRTQLARRQAGVVHQDRPRRPSRWRGHRLRVRCRYATAAVRAQPGRARGPGDLVGRVHGLEAVACQ